ncbi:kelch-like protein 20 [Hydra vulgaris]|uniref:Kelch-like protein 20 n=1 Tax=Hydra vulgaris TaxID=6087 RepID=A0ABM4BRL4_HYDVU
MVCKIFQHFSFANETLQLINALRKEQQLCDVILKVEKNEFHVHKVVLAGTSPYLRAMFTNGMLESGQKVITIHGIKSKTMEMLIEFSYTGVIEINIKNVEELFCGSSLLNIESLQSACVRFLCHQLDSSNCIGIRDFANIYSCTQLERYANRYIHQHFLDVSNTEEFLNLNVDDLCNLLKNDSLQVRNEEDVYNSVEKWLLHDYTKRLKLFPEVLKYIRIPLLSLEFLESKVFPASFIKANSTCQLILAKIINERPEHLPDYLCIQRALPQSIYAIGGRNSMHCHLSSVERYDIYTDSWFIEKNLSIARTAIASVCLNGCLYAVGGECAINNPQDETLYLPNVERFDPKTKYWYRVADFSIPRSFVSAVVCNGKLYAIGGEDRISSFNLVEQYSQKHNCWKIKRPMQKRRAGAGATSHDGMIYVAGGYDRTMHCDRASVECYCPIKNEWKFVAELEKARSGLNLVSIDSFIYAIGGRNRSSDTYFDICERFDLSTMQWTLISTMLSPRAWSGVAILKKKIFVIGGFDGINRLSSIEVYDFEKDCWVHKRNMNFARAGCGAAVL